MQNLEGKTALGLEPNVGALLCYVGNLVCSFGLIYSIIVISTDKTNKLVRFHAMQSIIGSIIGLIGGLAAAVCGIIGGAIDAIIGFPIFSLLLAGILLILAFIFVVTYFIAAGKAYRGQIYRIPVIGRLAEKWS